MLPDPGTPGAHQAVKRAVTADEVARLEREWAVLVQVRHPGLVSPLGPVEPAADGGAVLRMRALAGPSLALAPPYAAEEIAGIAEVVATTLADLHDAGFFHGGVGAAHVVLDEGGRPVLCSLGRGGPMAEATGDAGPTEDVADLGALLHHLVSWARNGEPATDPWALLRADLFVARRRRPPAVPDPFDVLTALADQATDVEAARRPAARALAAALAHQVPGRRLPAASCEPADGQGMAAPLAPVAPVAPDPSTAVGPQRRPWRSSAGSPRPGAVGDDPSERLRQRLRSFAPAATPVDELGIESPGARSSVVARHVGRALALGVAAVALVIAAPGAVALVRPPGRPHNGPRAAPSLTSRPPVTTGPGTAEPGVLPGAGPEPTPEPAGGPSQPTVMPPSAGPSTTPGTPGTPATGATVPAPSGPPPACTPTAPPSADVDGDGCAETVTLAAGIVRAGSARFSLGADVVAVTVGDWWCTGHATMAALSGDGSVSVFSAWPAMNGDLEGTVAGVVPGATGLGVAVPEQGGCDRPRADVPGQPAVVLDPGARP